MAKVITIFDSAKHFYIFFKIRKFLNRFCLLVYQNGYTNIYHLYFSDFIFKSFTLTKTLTEDRTVYYHVNISGENEYGSKINAPFIITYKLFNEGWAYISIKYNGSI